MSRGSRVPAAQRKADERRARLEGELALTDRRLAALSQQKGQQEEAQRQLALEIRQTEDAIQQMIGRRRLVGELLGLEAPMADVALVEPGGPEEDSEAGLEDVPGEAEPATEG